MCDESIRFGINLRVARVRQKLTQRQFADKMTAAGIKLSVDAVSKTERGERIVDRDFIKTAANVLNTTVRELTDKTVPKTPAEKLVDALRNTADLMEQVILEKQ